MKIDIKFNLGIILGIIFIVLKLVGIINWSWLWVLSPIWISFVLFVFVFFIAVVWFNKG
jgi:hypothetical protein